MAGAVRAGGRLSDVAAPRFLADAMLERLARWLRVLGVDAASAGGAVDDAMVVARARGEGRVLLTRDRRLAESVPGLAARVRAAAPRAQLREVVDAFAIGWPGDAGLFTRCLVCNVPLDRADGDAPAGAPAHAAGPFHRCPACGRLYWEGGHTRRMRAALAATFGVDGAAPCGHAACSPVRPHVDPHPFEEDAMSGSPGSSSAGTKGGRPPQHDGNHDVTARHGDDLAHGARASDATDAESSARGTRTGEADSRRQDPDDPASRHENISEA